MAPVTASRDVVVVGAGIAGLAAAWSLRDSDVVVLEAEERIGGRIRSERRGDYWLNFGAHVFGGPETATGRLFDGVGLTSIPVPGVLTAVSMNGRLVARGPVESFPFRLPLSLSDRVALVRSGSGSAGQSPATAAPRRPAGRARVGQAGTGCSRSSGTRRSPTSSARCRRARKPCTGRP